jgi:hypothetical protein
MTGGVKSKLISVASSSLLLNLQSQISDLSAAISIEISDVLSDHNGTIH